MTTTTLAGAGQAGAVEGQRLSVAECRARAATAPARLKRSSDRYRIARGMVPIWMQNGPATATQAGSR